MLKTNGGGICDHEVGGGKTVIMCTAAYEMKRLGLANKPMIIGLKANVFDIADTFRKAYPTVMSVSAVQLPNACSPIAVTLPGRVTLVSAEQPEKAYFPIVVSPSGRVTLVSAAQSLKAASPIVWTPAGRGNACQHGAIPKGVRPDARHAGLDLYFLDRVRGIFPRRPRREREVRHVARSGDGEGLVGGGVTVIQPGCSDGAVLICCRRLRHHSSYQPRRKEQQREEQSRIKSSLVHISIVD